MSVYVDDMRAKFGRMVMCHLWADSDAELLAMVDAIGVQRKWLQTEPKASRTHFDISLAKKALALARGAILTDRFGPSAHVAKLDIASGDPELVVYGTIRLAQIAKSRALRLENAKMIPVVENQPHGWGAVFNVSRKWHYFKAEHRSLCGKFMTLASKFETGNDDSADNCAACRRKLGSTPTHKLRATACP